MRCLRALAWTSVTQSLDTFLAFLKKKLQKRREGGENRRANTHTHACTRAGSRTRERARACVYTEVKHLHLLVSILTNVHV